MECFLAVSAVNAQIYGRVTSKYICFLPLEIHIQLDFRGFLVHGHEGNCTVVRGKSECSAVYNTLRNVHGIILDFFHRKQYGAL